MSGSRREGHRGPSPILRYHFFLVKMYISGACTPRTFIDFSEKNSGELCAHIFIRDKGGFSVADKGPSFYTCQGAWSSVDPAMYLTCHISCTV